MTRMWGVDPRLLCRKHLLGEHAELHQLVGSIEKGLIASVRGHAVRRQVDTSLIKARHDVLVEELLRRGYKHNSPLVYVDSLCLGSLDVDANLCDLMERCVHCRELVERGLEE